MPRQRALLCKAIGAAYAGRTAASRAMAAQRRKANTNELSMSSYVEARSAADVRSRPKGTRARLQRCRAPYRALEEESNDRAAAAVAAFGTQRLAWPIISPPSWSARNTHSRTLSRRHSRALHVSPGRRDCARGSTRVRAAFDRPHCGCKCMRGLQSCCWSVYPGGEAARRRRMRTSRRRARVRHVQCTCAP